MDLWSALVAAVDDIHAALDNLSEAQWVRAEELKVQLHNLLENGEG